MAQEEHNHKKKWLLAKNENLIKICEETEFKYEQKRLALLVAEANVMLVQETTKHVISDLRRELATTQYTTSMGTEKVWVILKAHKRKALQMVNESLEKGWRTWSAQASEL